MKKRFAITMDEETHRLLTIKAVRSGTTVGDVIDGLVYQTGPADDWKGVRAPMEEPVKKAIEPDKVKTTPKGQPTKGLGEIPGVTRGPGPGDLDAAWRTSQPVPKPGKKK